MRVTKNDYDDRAGLRGYVQFNIYTYMRAWYCHHSPNQVFAYPACNNGDCSENLPSVSNAPVLASYQITGSRRVGYWPEELRGRAPALLGHSHSDSYIETPD